MNKIKFFATIILSLFYVIQIPAQENYRQTIRGIVVDKHSQTPLIGVNVVLYPVSDSDGNMVDGTITDENGYFRLENVPVGRHRLQFSYIGYNSNTLDNILLNSGKELVLEIELEEKVIVTEEIVIKAYNRKDQPINEMAMISARSFTVEETERYAGSFNDPSRMVSSYAGVLSAGDHRNDIIIRGNSPNGLLWRLDNVDIPNPNHFGAMGTTGGPISILNNNLLSNSDFYTGAFPAEYGNALSGVFDLKMRPGNNEKREYTAQVGMNGFEFGMEGPFVYLDKNGTNASYIASYRYSFLDIMNAMNIDYGGGGIPVFQDLSFKVNVPSTRLGKFSLTGIGGLSYTELKASEIHGTTYGSEAFAGTNTTYGSDMGAISLNHQYFFNNTSRIQSNLAVSGSRSTAKIDTLTGDNLFKPFYRDKSSELKYSFSSVYKKKFNAKNNIGFGFVINKYDIDYHDSILNNNIFIKRTNTNGELMLYQSFAQLQHKFSDNLISYGGLHFQKFSLNDNFSVEPRASLKWNFSPKQSISLGYGLHSQTQPRINYFTETLIDTLRGTYVKTNKTLDFSKSHQFVLGYDYLINKDFRLKVETYYEYLYNIPVEQKNSAISLANFGADFFTTKYDSLINNGTGENYGVELTLEKFFTDNYYFLLTTSVFDSKYRGSDGIARNTAFNGNFVINGLAGYEFKIGKHNSLAVNLKGVYAGGKRYIPVDISQSEIQRKTVYDYNNAFEKRYDNYFKIDGRISFKMNGKRSNQEFAIDIQNITDHKNILTQKYDHASGITTYYQTGFFPVMVWRMQF